MGLFVFSRQGTEERVVHIRIHHMRTKSHKQFQSLGQMKKYKLRLPFNGFSQTALPTLL